MKLLLARAAGALVVLMLGLSSHAAVLNISTDGKLLGASGVIVNGESYDVSFLDGTCIALFDNCDGQEDFIFTAQEAYAASLAILEQVLLSDQMSNTGSIYDSYAELMNGCSDITPTDFFLWCVVITPYGDVTNGNFSGAVNTSLGWPMGDEACLAQAPNGSCVLFLTNSFDTQNGTEYRYDPVSIVYAVWTPTQTSVPEPATLALLGAGLLGLGMTRRRQRSQRIAQSE